MGCRKDNVFGFHPHRELWGLPAKEAKITGWLSDKKLEH
jgi:hypothetical protein